MDKLNKLADKLERSAEKLVDKIEDSLENAQDPPVVPMTTGTSIFEEIKLFKNLIFGVERFNFTVISRTCTRTRYC